MYTTRDVISSPVGVRVGKSNWLGGVLNRLACGA